jgi:hypothetical protein
LLKQRNTALTQKNRAREKVIRELKEGCRILEDQLRLMDTKYVELRNKLDWTRTQSSKEVRKIQSEANKLRVKWMMVAGSDQTLTALGIGGQDEIPEINNTSPQDRGRSSGSSGGGGKSLPPMGKKKNVLSFEAPNIVDDPAVDKDSPWGNDTKLNQLASSGR